MMFEGGLTHFNIYKADATGKQKLWATKPYRDYLNISFTDSLSGPSAGAASYMVSSVDTCGNESPLSNPHTAMYLEVKRGSAGNTLYWNPYEGFEVEVYCIYRGTNEDNLVFVDSVPASVTHFKDNASGNHCYQVRAKKKFSCYYPGGSLWFSLSNVGRVAPVLAADVPPMRDNNLQAARLFPNPATGQVTVEMDSDGNYELVVKNVLGETVRTITVSGRSGQVDLTGLSAGIYTVTLRQENAQKHFTILKN